MSQALPNHSGPPSVRISNPQDDRRDDEEVATGSSVSAPESTNTFQVQFSSLTYPLPKPWNASALFIVLTLAFNYLVKDSQDGRTAGGGGGTTLLLSLLCGKQEGRGICDPILTVNGAWQ